MKKSVVCMVESDVVAEAVVAKLRASGLSDADISVVLPAKSSEQGLDADIGHTASDGAMAGVSAGGAAGGAIGLLAGIGALAIPGLGPLIVAGPIVGLLGGTAAGAAVGAIAGVLVALGFPEREAKRYEGELRGGKLLISVNTSTGDGASRAEQIFRAARAEDICSTFEAPIPTTPRSGLELNARRW